MALDDDRTARTAEHERLATIGRPEEDLFGASPWYEWGPYLSERAWGTVREDYSASGDAWSYFPHDHARSRVYRWNEDGLAGLSDVRQQLCLALALWNGRDPILKERIFGLAGPEGNHGEDAKEYWWYLDALPSHAWLRWRYHYPQGAFPYAHLVEENRRRGLDDRELELIDTGVFDEDRYWSVDVTYAKGSPTDVLMRIEIENHGPDDDALHVLPTLWFRNTWSWDVSPPPTGRLSVDPSGAIRAEHAEMPLYRFAAASAQGAAAPAPLFCDNETNAARIFGASTSPPYPKDGINDHVVAGQATVNPAQTGTKAAWWYRVQVPAKGRVELRLRLHTGDMSADWAGAEFDEVIARRRAEADEFYAALLPEGTTDDDALIVRQAAAGLVWSKQYYPYGVARWLDGDPGQPRPPDGHRFGRNRGWRHLDANDILAMPDPWEYPWFAAWDLAFHAVAWAHLDPAFAKYQLLVLLREWFVHPNGALPAYEWSFDDVNPPVHAFAALRVFVLDGWRDYAFLERAFQKLIANFTWWLNRQDADGNYLYGGGFLGLDNISPIDRSHLPPGVTLEQADGTAWMAFDALAMLMIAVLLADHNEAYDDQIVAFTEQFFLLARAINRQGLYDPERGFFYDKVVSAEGEQRIEVETIGGAVPLFSSAILRGRDRERQQRLGKRFARFLEVEHADRSMLEAAGRLRQGGQGAELLLSVVSPEQLRLTLAELFDEAALLSPFGLRSLSKRYDGRPFVVDVGGRDYAVDYEPAESTTPMYGGNSNWRGPVWLPVNYLVVRSLLRFHSFLGDGFKVEHPTGSGRELTLKEASEDLAERIISLFRRGADGRRPVFGDVERFQTDPAWRDNLLFYEYFHGDNGAGLGASHQTGWTALVLDLILDPPRRGAPHTPPAARHRESL